MTTAQWLGLVLAVWGAAGMWVAGRGRWHGWAMGLAVQPVWAVFAIVVHSWPLLFSPLLYATVYARNLWGWRNKRKHTLLLQTAAPIVPVPPAVRRARAQRRQSLKAHRRGSKNFHR